MNSKLLALKSKAVLAGAEYHITGTVVNYVKYQYVLNKFCVLLFIYEWKRFVKQEWANRG